MTANKLLQRSVMHRACNGLRAHLMRAGVIGCIAATIGVLGCSSTVEPTKLPDDVAKFVERRETCDHFRGEEPYSPERRVQIEAAAEQYCRGSDRDLAVLRSRYRNNAIVLDRLNAYEAEIEAK